jgi:hypothetical protein
MRQNVRYKAPTHSPLCRLVPPLQGRTGAVPGAGA